MYQNPVKVIFLLYWVQRVEGKVLVFVFFSHLSTNRRPTTIRVHARRNIHAHQLLEKQLRRVRDMNLRDLRLRLAVLARVFAWLELPTSTLACFFATVILE